MDATKRAAAISEHQLVASGSTVRFLCHGKKNKEKGEVVRLTYIDRLDRCGSVSRIVAASAS